MPLNTNDMTWQDMVLEREQDKHIFAKQMLTLFYQFSNQLIQQSNHNLLGQSFNRSNVLQMSDVEAKIKHQLINAILNRYQEWANLLPFRTQGPWLDYIPFARYSGILVSMDEIINLSMNHWSRDAKHKSEKMLNKVSMTNYLAYDFNSDADMDMVETYMALVYRRELKLIKLAHHN